MNQQVSPACTPGGSQVTYFIKLFEVIKNPSKVVGTLCFKSIVPYNSTNKESQDYLMSCSNRLLNSLNVIKNQDNFLETIEVFDDKSLGVSINLVDSSEELKIKYSTDINLIGYISSDQDQLSYDLGVVHFSEERVVRDDVPDIKIVTLTVPLNIRV